MSEPPKPGWLLVGNSVVVIALCAWAVAAALAEGLAAFPFFWLPAVLAAWQHGAVFRRDPRSARSLAMVTRVAALCWLCTSAVGLLLMLRAPETGKLTNALVLWLGVAVYLTFTAWLNWRWYRGLAATGVSPRRWQFSIRGLLAITIWLAVVAGLTRWMVLGGR